MKIEVERETDGRWIAEAVDFPGAMAYGKTKQAAVAGARALALGIACDRLNDLIALLNRNGALVRKNPARSARKRKGTGRKCRPRKARSGAPK